jgi:hypothetical protein
MFASMTLRPGCQPGAWHVNLLEIWPVFGKKVGLHHFRLRLTEQPTTLAEWPIDTKWEPTSLSDHIDPSGELS